MGEVGGKKTEEVNLSSLLDQSLLDNLDDAIFLVEVTDDGVGKFLDANKSACHMLGYTKEELLQLTPKDVSSKEHLANIPDLTDMLNEFGHAICQGNHLTKSGRRISLELNINRVHKNGKNYEVTFARNISDKKITELALQESEDRYRKLVESSPDAIFLHDGQIILYANPAIVELFALASPQDLVGKTLKEYLRQFIHPDYYKAVKQRTEQTVNEMRDVSRLEMKHIRADGEIIDTETMATVFFINDKAVIQVIIRDITDRKRLEKESLKASKLEALGILAGGIAHDFNNMLTIILGNVSICEMDLINGNTTRLGSKIKEVKKALGQAQSLTKQLLTFAKGGIPVKEPVSFGEFIEEAVLFALTGSNVNCEFQISPDLWPVAIDRGQMNQVIHNLAINSVQAMQGGGTIQLELKNVTLDKEFIDCPAGPYVMLTFADEGIGIPEELLAKVFDPYFTTKKNGSGLGLTTSYSIVKKHGGNITVRPNNPGTAFYIFLPAIPGAEVITEKETGELIKGTGRILVMDDLEPVREMVREMLNILGYSAAFAASGVEAVSLYESAMKNGQPFDAVILDLTVPGDIGGEGAIKKLLEIDPEVKAIVSSGYSNDQIMAEYQRYGFKILVPKPYNITNLSRVLYQLLNADQSKLMATGQMEARLGGMFS